MTEGERPPEAPETPTLDLVPESTGSAGEQLPVRHESAGPQHITVGQTPLDQRHLGTLLTDYVDSRGGLPIAVAVAAFRDADSSRALLARQLDRLEEERDHFRDRYHEESKAAAVLRSGADSASEQQRLQKWVFGIGGVLLGTGAGAWIQVGSGWPPVPILLIVAGAILMWFGSPGRAKKV